MKISHILWEKKNKNFQKPIGNEILKICQTCFTTVKINSLNFFKPHFFSPAKKGYEKT